MVVAELADAALELSVVGSFSRLGFDARRRLFAWTDPPTDALAGQVALVLSGVGVAVLGQSFLAAALAGLLAFACRGPAGERAASIRAVNEELQRHQEGLRVARTWAAMSPAPRPSREGR